MAKKKTAWSDLLGDEKKSDEVSEEQPPTTVLMHTIVGNPKNPRPELDYSDDDPEFVELKKTMGEVGQLQPLAVVSRPVYERVKVDAVAALPKKDRQEFTAAEWVVVTGNRRLAAARQLGWTRIDIRVQDKLGDEEGRIDDAIIVENIHRKNLLPTREAELLQSMVERHGSQEKVAERIGKSQMYVSHRLALLKLAPDVRQQVDTGKVKIKDARQLAGRTDSHEQQRSEVARLKKEAAQPRPPRQKPGPQNPVLKSEKKSNQTDPDSDASTTAMPWDSPERMAQIIAEHMTAENRATLAKLLTPES